MTGQGDPPTSRAQRLIERLRDALAGTDEAQSADGSMAWRPSMTGEHQAIPEDHWIRQLAAAAPDDDALALYLRRLGLSGGGEAGSRQETAGP